MADWETRYQWGDTPWEKGYAAPPLTELLRRTDEGIWGGGGILVPGCGLGHDVRELAALGVPVVGLDLAATAIARAREFPGIGTEQYEVGDFLDPAWCAGRGFSGLWEHTCFCAIDPENRDRYAAAAGACLADGGLLAGVFFLTPYDPGEDSTGPPFATSIEELDQRFAPWFERIDGWVPEAAYPGRAGREWIGLFRRRPRHELR
jgi:SAM-dependent methyltransferase